MYCIESFLSFGTLKPILSFHMYRNAVRIFHLTAILRIKGIIASSSSKVVKEEDRRPPEEYDEPWDHKLKKSAKA